MKLRTIIVSLAASWLLVGAYSARGADTPASVAPSPQQQAAIAAIEKLGGAVRPVAHDSPLLDVDFHLGGGAVVDADLAQLKPLDKVIWLDLKGTKITSAGLVNLKDMKSLQRLHLETTAIDDAGLEHLAALENLEYLNLYGTNVTDAGIKRLSALKKLKRLYVWRTKVTDAGVTALKKEFPGLLIVGGAELPPLSPAEIAAAVMKKPPQKTLAKGQFVRVRLPGKERYLSLAEVQVQKTGSGAELQKSGIATQSSTYGGADAARAIDGNTSSVWANNSITHTNQETDPWWMVDLKSVQDIGRVVVFNRGDEVGSRLEGAVVEILDPQRKVVFTAPLTGVGEASIHPFMAK